MTVQLHGQLCSVAALDAELLSAMQRLFCQHFLDPNSLRFYDDLATKQWVILLRDGVRGELQGFSTLALSETTYQGQPITIVYSGDTLIHPEYWGTPALPRTWIQSVLHLTAQIVQPIYWLLISSGYKTYRFLPIFYRDFYPRYDRPTPPSVQALLDHVASERFGANYDPALGIVRFQTGATPLRAGVAEITKERLRDPHVAFFAERNPGYAAGDELVCLTQIHLDNLTAAGRRMLR